MLRLLILATDYPRPDGYISSVYIHSRNKIYVQEGIEVNVISFGASYNYQIDGVKVYTKKHSHKLIENFKFDILISHAPNLRNHYVFLKKYSKNFNKIVVFFHGHEVLKRSDLYPKPFNFNKKKLSNNKILRNVYDRLKLQIWNKYFTENYKKIHFVFVSNWMYKMFLKYVNLNPDLIESRKHIIYNSIGDIFEKDTYNLQSPKEYDFITIRSYIDGSKYGIDIIVELAKKNPKYSFCVIGKGNYFNHYNKPRNLTFINENLGHDKIIKHLNASKFALMPTRLDAQGVMACEVASFGIPTISSKIDICEEVFGTFHNVYLIDNKHLTLNLDNVYNKHYEMSTNLKNEKYFKANTIMKEIKLYYKIMEMSN